jgi:Mg-chelatase subunit ChlD
MAEISWQNPQALLVLPLVWLLLVLFSWPRRFKPFGAFLLRLMIIVLISLALAQPALPASTAVQNEPPELLVLLVDQSASLGTTGQETLRLEAARLSQAREDVVTIFFADRPILVDDPLVVLSTSGAASGQDSQILNSEASNLAEALLLGGELLKGRLEEQPGRLVLLSDGLPTAGDALAAAQQLVRQNIPVDVLIPSAGDLQAWRGSQNEVRLVELNAPPALRQGETYDIEVIVHSEAAAEANLNLTQSGTTLAEDVVTLETGLNRFTFAATADKIGPLTFRAEFATDEDRLLENNNASAFAQVYPKPHILVVGAESIPTRLFASVLRQVGFETTSISPGGLPDRLSELEMYAGMVLVDTPAEAFELEQMIAIQEFVRSLGRGLVVTAGRNSFTLGRYEDTPMAELLPLSLEPPPREERPPVALLLVIDHSGSMVEQTEPATRLAMAKEAAIRATDILGPDDLLGILMFDNQYEWVVPFQQVNDGLELLEIQQRIARVPPGGGTRILQALEVALPALIAQETVNSRHVVLLTDGKSFDGDQGIPDYDRIVDAAVAENITLSAIAIGKDADQQLLSHLAERGRGRYHFAETPDELPALTISESDILRSNSLQEGDFGAAIYQPHPILRGLFSPLPVEGREPAPGLKGYLAMTPKPHSEIALQIGPGDPLLSVWGYGLGRVVAWSSDTGDEWASAWRDWPEFSRFWGQVVGYTLPAPDLGLLQLDTVAEPDGTITLVAEGVTSIGQPVDLARTQVRLITPGGQENQIALQQVAPGRYERRLRLPDVGAYQLTATQAHLDVDEPDETATIGFVLPYPAEYALPADEAGAPLLEQIAAVTGGRTFSLGQLASRYVITPAPTEAPVEPVELWPWLLGVALVLWPIEIAWRRWGRLRIQ